MNFYSQHGEDYFIFRNFLNKKREDGIYVECGASDGVCFSNTLFFHNELGYKGVMIEPSHWAFPQLVENRKNDICCNCAIDNKIGNAELLGIHATAGLTKYMDEEHIKIHHKNKIISCVKTYPFGLLMNKCGIKYIDFLSIDMEGGEKVLLETMDWSIPVYFVCIELDGKNSQKDEDCRQILKNNGFTFVHRVFINEFYVNNSYFRKNILYDDKRKFTFSHDTDTFHHVSDIDDLLLKIGNKF